MDGTINLEDYYSRGVAVLEKPVPSIVAQSTDGETWIDYDNGVRVSLLPEMLSMAQCRDGYAFFYAC